MYRLPVRPFTQNGDVHPVVAGAPLRGAHVLLHGRFTGLVARVIGSGLFELIQDLLEVPLGERVIRDCDKPVVKHPDMNRFRVSRSVLPIACAVC